MKMPFPKLLLLALGLSLSAGLAACSKEDIPLATPATSSLAGTISPLGAVTLVTATAPNGATFTATPHPATGNYSLTGLTVGTAYSISYTPATNYAAPAPQTATPTAGTVGIVPAVTLTTSPNATASTVEQRFYRVEDTRTRDVDGGTGVGLAISRAIARAHGGDLTAHSDGSGHGARFVLALPTVGS